MRIAMLLAGLLLCGCAGVTTGLTLEGSQQQEAMLRVDNAALGRQLAFGIANQRRQDDLLTVAARLSNRTRSDLALQYRVSWFDGDGMALESDASAWQPLLLHGGEQHLIQASALRPEAEGYRIDVRRVVEE